LLFHDPLPIDNFAFIQVVEIHVSLATALNFSRVSQLLFEIMQILSFSMNPDFAEQEDGFVDDDLSTPDEISGDYFSNGY
jgi:hypothetical protein